MVCGAVAEIVLAAGLKIVVVVVFQLLLSHWG
jgi:hypothetical protein